MHMSVFRLVHLPPSVAALLLLLPMATARASVLTWASKDGSSPQGYDYSKTTAENYHQPGARLRREFLQTRATLDYKYHPRYSLERQALQDEIIRSMLSYEDMQRGQPSTRSELDRLARGSSKSVRQPQQPWAIFTAGCMGKSRTAAPPHRCSTALPLCRSAAPCEV